MSYPDTTPAAFTWADVALGSYPDTTPAAFSWESGPQSAAAFDSPLGSAAAVAEVTAVPAGYAAVPSPLGAVVAVAQPVVVASAVVGSPLGEFGAVVDVVYPRGTWAVFGPLGDASALAQRAASAVASVESPLGSAAVYVRTVVTVAAAVAGPLGMASAVARLDVAAAFAFTGPLGATAGVAWHGQPAEPAPHAGAASIAWAASITLGGADISDQLIGAINIEHADNEASIAEFSWLPSTTLDPMTIIGQPVTIDFTRSAGTPYTRRMFTGVVETPSFDVQTGTVSCICHDQLQERVAEQSRAWIDSAVGGRWSEAVSSAPADNWEYLQARIASVPKSIAIDPTGAPRVLPWRGAGLTTAATYTAADWLDGSLSVSLPSRDSLRTRITCRLQYRYERLRARCIQAEWSQPFDFFVWRDTGGELHALTWLTVSMVKSAVEGLSGWEMQGAVDIESPAYGVYLAEGWSDGGYVITPDVAPTLALGFASYHATRWQQTVTEDYTVTLVNAELESALGKEISEELGATLVAEFDQAAWDTDASVGPGPVLVTSSGSAPPPVVGDVIETWQPEGYDPAARDEVLRTLLDQAWVRLLSSTRTGRVRWRAPIRPQLWLDWWITINHDRLRAAGKVVAVSHELDMNAGSAVTSVEIAVGLPGNTYRPLPVWSLPSAPADTSPPGSFSCTIGEYVGGLEDSPPFDETSMVGFATNLEDLLTDAEKESREWYPHQLSIQAPDIEETARDPLTLAAEQTIVAAIPTDLLEFV